MTTAVTVKPWTRIPDYNSSKDMTTPVLDFDRDKCRQCGICTFICPARSVVRDRNSFWNAGFPYLIDAAPGVTNCIACGCCLAACPEEAISIIRNFSPGYYYKRLTQPGDLVWPKKYMPDTDSEKTDALKKTTCTDLPETGGNWSLKNTLVQKFYSIYWIKRGFFGVLSFLAHEKKQNRMMKTLKKFIKGEKFDISWADLLSESAEKVPDKTFLLYNDEQITYSQMNENANRLGNYLIDHGGEKGMGTGIIMRNSPRFLDIFFGSQKAGMYTVPINPEIKGDGLAYIVNHSDIKSLFVDAELLEQVICNLEQFENISAENIIVNDIEDEASGIEIPEGMKRLSEAYGKPASDPGIKYNPEDICLIIYTSGTTGPPKGVVYRYNTSGVLLLSLGGRVFFNKNDVYYTYLSLCHGNALFLTVSMSLAVRCTVALSRKFSASRFWDTVRKYNATVFNTIGTIIPILMKQPERMDDRSHSVRTVLSAACPVDMWEPFEQRFGVKIFEGYGAVDGGGKGIMNLGTAPSGSLGKPPVAKSTRIVDENGNDVPDNTPGELLFAIKNRKSLVEYYKNPEASEKKSKDGWLHTGDIIKRDSRGYFYFVGRNTESMRKGGENVSAYEVEHVIMQHPDVEDAAVYAVPSELGEDEIVAAIKLINGNWLDPKILSSFLSERLAKYAVPRYIRYVSEFPKTNTHRIIKKPLEEQGITEDTYDTAVH